VQDSVCQWNVTLLACQRRLCTWSDKSSCTGDSRCEWLSSNLTCVPQMCPYSTTLPDVCQAAGAQCVWANNRCIKACPYLDTMAGCLDSGRCDWTFAGECRDTCSSLYSTPRTCDADVNCVWSLASGQCVRGCSVYPNASMCLLNTAVCVWKQNACQTKCSVRYADVVGDSTTQVSSLPCSQDATCEVVSQPTGATAITYKCIEPCSTMNETECNSAQGQVNCQVNATSGACEPNCNSKYGTSSLCNADPACVWPIAYASCWDRCEKMGLTLPDDCANVEYCVWSEASSSCVTRCGSEYDAQVPCMADPLCLWEPTRNDTCVQGCGFHNNSEYDCQEQAGCAFDPIEQYCRRACYLSYYTKSSCIRDPSCRWDGSNVNSAGQTINCTEQICRYTTQAECTADDQCQYADNQCKYQCNLYVTEADCLSNSMCTFSKQGKCLRICEKLTNADCTTNPDEQCVILPVAISPKTAPSCTTQCSVWATELSCATAASSACYWSATLSTCMTRCEYTTADASTVTGAQQCLSNTECSVDGTECRYGACMLESKETCTDQGACAWRNGTCVRSPCQLSTMTACLAFPTECEWTTQCIQTYCPLSECEQLEDCMLQNNGTECVRKPCAYHTVDECTNAFGCIWDPSRATQQCYQRPKDCVYSEYSAWSACSLPCQGGTQVQRRTIIKDAQAGGIACDSSTLAITRQCNTGVQCVCGSVSDALTCVKMPSCEWTGNVCVDAPTSQCWSYTTAATCVGSAANCGWVAGQCLASTSGCTGQTTQASCAASALQCQWVTQEQTNSVAFTAGGSGVYPFAGASVRSGTVDGLTVAITTGYSRGADILSATANATGIVATWFPTFGQLRFEGTASGATYTKLLASVRFVTTSMRLEERELTWNVGLGVHFNPINGHAYRFFEEATSWALAQVACQASSFAGASGSLATISTQQENDFLAWHVGVDGWLGATQAQDGTWAWADGTVFWSGGSPAAGGAAVGGAFSNWDTLAGVVQPSSGTGMTQLRMALNGMWYNAQPTAAVVGYVCEYGGTGTPLSLANTFGTAILEGTGCAPATNSSCGRMASATQCTANLECRYDGTQCVDACRPLSASACAPYPLAHCAVSRASVPPICAVDKCSSASPCADGCTNDPVSGACVEAEGCPAYLTEPTCGADSNCQWVSGACVARSCTRYVSATTGCNATCQAQCTADPLCSLDTDTNECIDVPCVHSDATCEADAACTLASASATAYTRDRAPVAVFASATLDVTSIVSLTVAIVDQFHTGDTLTAESAAQWTYAAATGILTVTVSDDFQRTLQSVKFSTTDLSDVDRTVSWTATTTSAVSVFVPALSAVIQIEPATVSTISAARAVCGTANGVAITTGATQRLVVQLLGGSAAYLGATGTTVPGGSAWQWDGQTTNFFVGSPIFTTSVVGFTEFASGEPSGPGALVVQADGTWAAVASTASYSAGTVLCTVAPTAGLTGSVVVNAAGCLPKLCSYETQAICTNDHRCTWSGGSCSESPCMQQTTREACSSVAQCYYDATQAICLVNPAGCALSASCAAPCVTQDGVCTAQGCARYPDLTTCAADPDCEMVGSTCTPRLCGYTSQDACLQDTYCQWTSGACAARPCYAETTSAACTAVTEAQCTWASLGVPRCSVDICGYGEQELCIADSSCMWTDKCVRNECPSYSAAECPSPACAVRASDNTCQASECAKDQAECLADSNCMWAALASDPSVYACQAATIQSRAAASLSTQGECTVVEKNYGGLAAALVILTLLLSGAFGWITYRQTQHRKSKAYKFGTGDGDLGVPLNDVEDEGTDRGSYVVPPVMPLRQHERVHDEVSLDDL
jgi:hypothetical protein